jgi:hypothetical protein
LSCFWIGKNRRQDAQGTLQAHHDDQIDGWIEFMIEVATGL